MAKTKRKTAKKPAPAKRKRKASPAQLAALARGRAKRKANTGGSKKRKSSKSVSVPVKQERKTMAKKKRSSATTTKKRSVKSAVRSMGGRAKGLVPMVKDVGIAVAGGIGSSVFVNKLPIANPKLKAALPLVAGLLVSSVLGKKKPIFKEIGHGMAVVGAIALLKQFAPNVPMLAGEDEVYYIPEGYQGDMMQLGYDEDPDLMGDMLQLGDESEEYVSPASM